MKAVRDASGEASSQGQRLDQGDGMLKLLKSPLVAEWISASAVVLVSAIVGSFARDGMTAAQWTGGITAIVAAITWAVMVRVWREETAS
jgi:hypothetical protein